MSLPTGYTTQSLLSLKAKVKAQSDDMFAIWVEDSVLTANYYVSPNGDNTDGLTPGTAFNTLADLNGTTFVPGDTIAFENDYVYDGSLTIGQGGTDGNPITFTSYYPTGTKPTINGFVEVSEWTNTGGNIWESTNALSTLNDCKVVEIDGVIKPMGRVPSSGAWYNVDSFSGATSVTSTGVDAAVTNWTGAKICMRKERWIIDSNPITNHVDNTITYSGGYYDAKTNWGFFIQDDIRCCTIKDDWYYNPTTKKLSIYSSTEPQNVRVSAVETFTDIDSLDHISFENIQIEGVNNDAFNLSNSKHITVNNCGLYGIGKDPILGDNTGVSNGCTFTNNTIDGCLNSAIKLDAAFSDFTITGNTITNIALLVGATGNGDGMGNAIRVEGDTGLIQYNNLTNIGYQPIAFGGNDVIVNRNVTDNYCLMKDDGAGIYTSKTRTGREITENIVLNGIGNNDMANAVVNAWDQQNEANGIYLDIQSDNCIIQNNSVFNTGGAAFFVHNNPGNNDIQYNNFAKSTNYNGIVNIQMDWGENTPMRNYTFKNNYITSYNATNRVFRLETEYDDVDLIGDIDFNVYARPISEGTTIYLKKLNGSSVGYDLPGWQALTIYDDNSNISPKAVPDESEMYFYYNASTVATTTTLPFAMVDMDGAVLNEITLQPYRSITLLKN